MSFCVGRRTWRAYSHCRTSERFCTNADAECVCNVVVNIYKGAPYLFVPVSARTIPRALSLFSLVREPTPGASAERLDRSAEPRERIECETPWIRTTMRPRRRGPELSAFSFVCDSPRRGKAPYFHLRSIFCLPCCCKVGFWHGKRRSGREAGSGAQRFMRGRGAAPRHRE